MKKIVSVFFALILLVTLVSCGGQSNGETGEATGSTGGKDSGVKQTEPETKDEKPESSDPISSNGLIDN